MQFNLHHTFFRTISTPAWSFWRCNPYSFARCKRQIKKNCTSISPPNDAFISPTNFGKSTVFPSSTSPFSRFHIAL